MELLILIASQEFGIPFGNIGRLKSKIEFQEHFYLLDLLYWAKDISVKVFIGN